ncbi:MAG: tetratricopeptide repeat protein, partial [Actinomycetota bacterium]|nr:tetratricopeptide repeat protein [Actinomycetota bacterium]
MSAPESAYISRAAERLILDQVDNVRFDGASRAVLLYGTGGVGKTRMLRALARDGGTDPAVRWVHPLDVDDSEYWVLENLQRQVADALDPDRRFFAEFIDYLAKTVATKPMPFHRDAVVGHHERARAAFGRCYRRFVVENETTVVIPLDTVEVVRNTFFLTQLYHWMRDLPATLFVLSGRPTADQTDAIKEILTGNASTLGVVTVTIDGFTDAEARQFLADSDIRADLNQELVQALVSLTEGHPLWLELAVDYLRGFDLPPELEEPPPHDAELRDRFRRRMVTPYRSADFWPEAIKRLAVVRHSVDKDIWQAIMADRALPAEYEDDWGRAWETLRAQPWIRPRANGRDVTLHDALAEELTSRLIPLHDQDETWRTRLWRMAAEAFRAAAADYADVIADMDRLLVDDDQEDNPAVLQEVAKLDVHKRRMDQLRAARLHYLLLSDIDHGTEEFATQFDAAVARNDLHFMELANHELDRFLAPRVTAKRAFDAISMVVDRCRLWLRRNPRRLLELGLNAAGYLIQSSQPAPAVVLLDSLPDSEDHILAFRLAAEHGNACMRIPGKVADAGEHFRRALEHAEALDSPYRERLTAQARKELGYYARNIGLWDEANDHYSYACFAITDIVRPGGNDDDRAELASIRTNWAYLKALRGEYEQAHGLVESALDVRRRLNRPLGTAISLSTAGEVCRYDQQYATAWDHYQRAEILFVTLRNIPWLGQIYQEQAICLFQAAQNNVALDEDPLRRAQDLIVRSVNICEEYAVRWYPSALNRAGRIFGAEDPDRGLEYLRGAVEQAEKVADGWFLSASLIELLELCYQTWTRTGDNRYRTEIRNREQQVLAAIERYRFADLKPRWALLTGHLSVHDALARQDHEALNQTVSTYATALLELAGKRVGSHGAAALTAEFTRFGELFQKVPGDVQRSWYAHLRKAWSARRDNDPADTLLARLDRLY